MHMEMTPNRPKPGPHDAAAPALIVTTQDDAPLCVHGMDSARTHHSRQDRPSRCKRDDSRPDDGGDDDRPHAGRRGWTQTGRQDDYRDGRPARQKGAQSRTEDAQPQPVRIAENTSIHLSL